MTVLSVRSEVERIGDVPAETALRRDAERALAGVISARLAHHRPTVVACGLGGRERASLLALARGARVPAHLVVLTAATPGRGAADLTRLRGQIADGHAAREGYASARLIEPDQAITGRFGNPDARNVDVIGDVHGCLVELRDLLTTLGYRDLDGSPSHPDRRMVVFLGDLVAHGPDSTGVVMLADRMVTAGCAMIGALGNHDWWLLKRLVLRRNTKDHGSRADTFAEFAEAGPEVAAAVTRLFMHAPSHSVLDNGALVVTHGACRPDLLGRRPVRDRDDEASELSLYGERYGGVDEDSGLLRRSHRWILDWPADGPTVIFGHDVVGERPKVFGEHGKVIGLDCGVASGGALAAMRWPERKVALAPARTPQVLELDRIAA